MSLVTPQSKNFNQSFENVSKAKPCRICGKPDQCSRTTDGAVEFCYRVQFARPDGVLKTSKDGREFHAYFSGVTGSERRQEVEDRIAEETADVPAAADDVLDEVYRAILAACPLTPAHRLVLTEKGLTDEDIANGLYASWPEDPVARRKILNPLFARFTEETMVRVPGVYVQQREETIEQAAKRIEDGRPPLRDGALACGSGILHPICSRDGHIVAMQIRDDEGDYFWLSSSRHGGPGCRRVLHYPPHVARPIEAKTIRVVESVRAANMATRASGVLTVALCAVGAWGLVLPEARDLGVEEVIIANDADARTKASVSGPTRRFADVLAREGYRIALERWSPTFGKGLDDCIASGHLTDVETLRGADLWRYVRDMLRSSGAPKDAVVEARLVIDSTLQRITDDPAFACRAEVYTAAAALDPHSVEFRRVEVAVKKAIGKITKWSKAVDEARGKTKKTKVREEAEQQGRKVVDYDDHVTLAKTVAESLATGVTGTKRTDILVADEGEVYRAIDLVFEPVKQEQINSEIRALSQALVLSSGTKLRINASDIRGIRQTTYEHLERSGFFGEAPKGLAFRDKFVAVDVHGNVTVEPLTRAHRARWRYDFDYAPDAEPTNTIAELRKIWRHRDEVTGQWVPDADVEDKIALIQEFAGVSYLGYATKFKSAIWATSTQPDTAKSTVGQIIAANAPSGSVASVSPANWTDQQSLSALAGKLFNFVDELPTRGMMNATQFKYVVNGGKLEAKVVYRAKFEFAPVAGQYHGINGFWRPDEGGEAVLNKIIPLVFGRRFERHEWKLDLVEQLAKSDGAAFVAWAIRGAVRALQKKALTIPASSLAMRAKWMEDSSGVRQFVADAGLEPVDLTTITDVGAESKLLDLKTIYEMYRTWYDANHADSRRAIGSSTLGKELTDLGYFYRTRFTETPGLSRYLLKVGAKKKADEPRILNEWVC